MAARDEAFQLRGATALHEACAQGDHARVTTILSGAVDASPRDFMGVTPLHIACRLGRDDSAKIVRALLDHGAAVNSLDRKRRSPITLAVRSGKADVVLALLEAPTIDVNCRDGQSRTPLWLAAHAGHEPIVRLLLDANARCDVADSSGMLPYHVAMFHGHTRAAAIIHEAAPAEHHVSTAAAKRPGGPTRPGERHASVSTPLAQCKNLVRDKDEQGLRRFLRKYGVPRVMPDTDHGRSLLHFCADADDAKLIDVCVRAGHAVDVADADGNTPLHLAAGLGHLGALTRLCEHGAVTDARNAQGMTPYELAVCCKRLLCAVQLGERQTNDPLARDGRVVAGVKQQ